MCAHKLLLELAPELTCFLVGSVLMAVRVGHYFLFADANVATVPRAAKELRLTDILFCQKDILFCHQKIDIQL